jgi:hypothetical protein
MAKLRNLSSGHQQRYQPQEDEQIWKLVESARERGLEMATVFRHIGDNLGRTYVALRYRYQVLKQNESLRFWEKQNRLLEEEVTNENHDEKNQIDVNDLLKSLELMLNQRNEYKKKYEDLLQKLKGLSEIVKH